jgi:hypothetical protein
MGRLKNELSKHNYQMTLWSPFCFFAFFTIMVALEYVFMGRQFNKG